MSCHTILVCVFVLSFFFITFLLAFALRFMFFRFLLFHVFLFFSCKISLNKKFCPVQFSSVLLCIYEYLCKCVNGSAIIKTNTHTLKLSFLLFHCLYYFLFLLLTVPYTHICNYIKNTSI